MNRLTGVLLWLTVVMTPTWVSAQTFPGGPIDNHDSERELVVDFRDGTSASEVASVGDYYHIHFVANSAMATDDGMYRVSVPANDEDSILSSLRNSALVEAADENMTLYADFVPNDPRYSEQWGLARVGTESAWNTTCGRGAVVAVIDTGVACENFGDFSVVTDLVGTRCVPGWNFVDGTAHANDDQGHGTHVAGTIAQATNNGLGTAGVAYCATIMPVKVLSRTGSGSLADVAEGIRWAADHGANVANLSLGGGGHSKVMEQAVQYARNHGTVVICAAGNSGGSVGSPANEDGAFAVSAIDSGDRIASFSSRGQEIDIAAPGVGILQQTICENGRNHCEQYASWSGTSMATPHVAGVAALIVSTGVTNPDVVERILRDTATHSSTGNVDPVLFGSGVVSASGAVSASVLRHGFVRILVLFLLAFIMYFYINSKKGTWSWGWLVPSLVVGVGFFPISLVVHRTFFPGAELLSRPILDWDIFFMGANTHNWLPLANLVMPLVLVGLGFSFSRFRSPIAGVSLGTASYLLASFWMNDTIPPFGRLAFTAWVLLNTAVCIWIARIGIDKTVR